MSFLFIREDMRERSGPHADSPCLDMPGLVDRAVARPGGSCGQVADHLCRPSAAGAKRPPPGEGGTVGRSPSGPHEPGTTAAADPGPGGSGQRPARPTGRTGGSGHPDQRAAAGRAASPTKQNLCFVGALSSWAAVFAAQLNKTPILFDWAALCRPTTRQSGPGVAASISRAVQVWAKAPKILAGPWGVLRHPPRGALCFVRFASKSS